jgi:DNA gyrase/topoisomerase IV subunit B
LITEGKSAKSQVSDARNPETIAAYALTGKVNNVYGASPSAVLKMGKLTNLLKATGLVPGQPANPDTLNYGRIVIAADADHDGDDITTILINVFYQFWPNLFDPARPIIYRLIAPNVCLVKGKQRKHFPNRDQYERNKHAYDNTWEVNYYKGLGSMTTKDWEMVLNDDKAFVPVVDDGTLGPTLELLFSKDADARKDWLMK